MSRHKVTKLEEKMQSLFDVSMGMVEDGLEIDNYNAIMEHYQKRHKALTGCYYSFKRDIEPETREMQGIYRFPINS